MFSGTKEWSTAMDDHRFYLKPNVQVEPLYNQWYCWTHLISPAPAAMNIANSHLKIMKSYVASPQIHANAVKNPALLGGPFIDYEGGRVQEIKALLEKTVKEQAHMIELAESIKRLQETLRNEAKGHSLEPLYAKIPANLRGYVELVYDLNNNASARFIESLLYRSEYYDPSLQSLSLSLINQDHRAFALSTPRLPDAQTLQISIPFTHEAIDVLFEMKYESQPLGRIRELLGLDGEQLELFKTFLTEEKSPEPEAYTGEGVRVRYYGHACLLIETKNVNILTDPSLSYAYDNGLQRYTYLDVPPVIDYVVITHGHQDHIMMEALLQLRHKIKNIVVPRSRGGCLEDPSLKMVLQHIGFKNIIELNEMESLEIADGSITGLPFFGEHADLHIGTKLAHLVKVKDKSFLMAADSNNIEPVLYQHVARLVGDIDVLFIGMECDGAPLSWVYGPLITIPLDRKMDQSRRLSGSNYERGIGIVNQFNFKEVYVYAMGQEPWLNYVMCVKYTEESQPIVASGQLIEDCKNRGINAERLFAQKELEYL
jgi:L-ascorbate metabolism protein UlaG (beta-lactamase superfamily)